MPPRCFRRCARFRNQQVLCTDGARSARLQPQLTGEGARAHTHPTLGPTRPRVPQQPAAAQVVIEDFINGLGLPHS